MDFILKPSLEHYALFKVAALLWNPHDTKAFVTEFSKPRFSQEGDIFRRFIILDEKRERWQKFENQVINKISQLIIPTHLKEKLFGYIQAIGIQILNWMKYHRKFCCFDLDPPNEFCWTSQGTVDKKKTAERLIRDDNIDVITRYKFACFYCLEDDILELWNKIPESQKEFLCSEYEDDIRRIPLKELVSFWTHYLKENCWCSPYDYMFCLAVESGNKATTEYFLKKLDLKNVSLYNAVFCITKKRDFCLQKCESPKEYYNEVLYYLLSQMNSDEQLDLFKRRPLQIMCCFLDWPLQSLFVQTVILLWNYFPKSDCYLIFIKIIHKELIGYKDYNYKKMFRDVWQQIPDTDKTFIINGDHIVHLLHMLFHIKDIESIKLIFQSATLTEKRELIFSKEGRSLCRNMIYIKEWGLVKFFIKLVISSKSDMIKFKQEFQENIQIRVNFHIEDKYAEEKGHWEEFFRILDDLIRAYDKRNIDEGESSSVKRL